ncbi:MAG: HAMP domain-containing histidine kinase [candidate division Zixibacteria bacterium]|nr:HAMP domain-containing histidine kinase [candidate division Zixibacteria bacterium]
MLSQLVKDIFSSPKLITIILGVGMVIVVSFFIYSNQTIISQLENDAARVSRAYARLWQYAASEATSGSEINFIFEEIIKKANFPIIVTSIEGEPMYWTVDVPQEDTTGKARERLKQYIEEMDAKYQAIPIYYGPDKIIIHNLHYGDSRLIKRLQYMPYIEIAVIVVFLLFAWFSFRNARKSEQNYIYAGMAKESAHQLGTPLSALMGWVELLKLKYSKEDFALPDKNVKVNFAEIIDRMQSDLHRLDRVATRFGSIGSIPDLEECNINQPIAEVVAYFHLRLPGGGKGVEIIEQYSDLPDIKINLELIGWVVENLIKNSLEAIDPKTGKIFINTKRNNNWISISVIDNGKGIVPSNQKRIFDPGFTTRKRGWGLGLTLARRIVVEYHRGKFRLAGSEPNQKTEFIIELPV